MRREPSPDAHPSPATLAAYQRSLDRVFALSRDLIPKAPTWQAGLYQSVRACYTEMRSHPDALRLHFIATATDAAVQRTRGRHRARLLALLDETRDDAPPLLHAELLLSMIHRTLRAKIVDGEAPPALDDAEQTFATLLFDYRAPTAA
jgi:hypothetical protein